jgi:hypothetical protein
VHFSGHSASASVLKHYVTPHYAYSWKTKVLEAKAFSAHLRMFFAQTKPLAFGRKNTNVIILKSEIKWRLFYAHFL